MGYGGVLDKGLLVHGGDGLAWRFRPIGYVEWVAGEAVPLGAWREVMRRGVEAGLSGQVVTARMAEVLYPKREYLESLKS